MLPRLWLVVLYVGFALPAVLFLAVNMPVYGNADETNHLMRAEMVLGGGIVGLRTDDGRSGGAVDSHMARLLEVYWPLLSEPGTRVDRAMLEAGAAIGWGGPRMFVDMPNTAIYPPTLYAPVMAGLVAGKAAGLSIQDSIVLGRLANGLTAIALAAAALGLAACGRLLLFAVLLLPMSLAQMASASQDALLIGGGALLVALVSRPLVDRRPATDGEFLAIAVAIALLSMSRPTNFAFVLFLAALAPRRLGAISAVSATAAVSALVLGWALTMAMFVRVQQTWDAVVPDPVAQLRHLVEQPAALPQAVWATLAADGWGKTVTLLGWLGWGAFNIVLPDVYYGTALAMLGAALSAELMERRGVQGWRLGLAWAVLGAAFAGIWLLQYLSFTAVAGTQVSGVQGRYFLPLLAGCGLLLPGLGRWVPPGWTERLRAWAVAALTVAVLAFPLYTLVQLPRAVLLRAYVTLTG